MINMSKQLITRVGHKKISMDSYNIIIEVLNKFDATSDPLKNHAKLFELFSANERVRKDDVKHYIGN